MPTSTFRIVDLECMSCAMEMEGICEDTPGVTKAEVSARKQTIQVEHEETVSPMKLKEALDAEGYEVEPVENH